MTLPDHLQQQILAYAKQTEPHEMCGFLLRAGSEIVFFPCQNVHTDPEHYFEISPEDYLRAESQGEIVAVVHSHPQGEPRLSGADLQMQLLSGVDWWLVCDDWLYFFPFPAPACGGGLGRGQKKEVILPLVGREFVHGQTDCYTLFRDFYRLSGVILPDFERADEWWLLGENLYLDNLTKHGFKRLDNAKDLQLGDVILVQVGADVPNHAAIYLGEQMVLHHSPKRLSKRELYDGYWLKHTHSLWRYEQWSNLDFTVALNSLANSLNSM